MPKITPIINNFNAGELSPLLDARTDLKKYYSGCQTLQNFIPTPYGGVVRRPGTYYVCGTKHSVAHQNKKSRLIPFEFNVEQAYVLEFGEQYIRFFKNGGQILYTDIDFNANPTGVFAVGATMTGATSGAAAIVVAEVSTQVYTIKFIQGTFVTETINCGDKSVAASSPTTSESSAIVEITSPYLEADLFDLHFVQSADVLYIVGSGGGYQPRKLSRYSHDHWVLKAIDFEWGPFLDNNVTDITITPPALAVDCTYNETFDASSEGGGFPPDDCFNDTIVNDNGWIANSAINEWIEVQFAAAKDIIKIRVQNCQELGNDNCGVRHCKLEASATGAWGGEEVKIAAYRWIGECLQYNTDEIELNQVANLDDWAEILFTNGTTYAYYRLICTDNWGGGQIRIQEIEMMEATGDEFIASTPLFTANHVGSIWKLAYPRTDNAQQGEITATGEKDIIALKNTCRFRTTASGSTATEYKIQRKYAKDSDYHDFRVLRGGVSYDLNWEEPVKAGADYRIYCSAYGTQVDYTFSCEQHYDVGYVKITAFTDTTHVDAVVIESYGNNVAATKKWAEGAWSDYRGWPRTVGFFQGRLVYGGNTHRPLTLWFSESNVFEGMWAKTCAENEIFDDDALIFTISAAQQNMIRWVVGQDALLVGTAGATGKLSSFNKSQPLTPENIPEYKPQSSYGSGTIQPYLVNDAVLFVEREDRKLREFKYDFDSNIFVARDLTMYSEHITEGGIKGLAHQKQPDSILWAIRGDGTLLGMTYERLEEIFSWHRHVTDGNVESIAVISAAGQSAVEDEIWMIVKRIKQGAIRRYVEYMKPRDWGSTETDVFFVDSGLSSAGSGGNTYIGGLAHLQEKTVDVLIDGKVGDRQVVGTGKGGSSGYIDLKIGGVAIASTIKLHVGLNYVSDLQPMKLEFPIGDLGTARGRKKRINEAVISFKDMLGGFYGRDADNLDELNHAVTGTAGVMTPLKTTEETVSWPGEDETAGNILIRQTYPLPMTVRCIIPKLVVSEL